MQRLKAPTKQQMASLIGQAIREVASWPDWKADPAIIDAAKRQISAPLPPVKSQG